MYARDRHLFVSCFIYVREPDVFVQDYFFVQLHVLVDVCVLHIQCVPTGIRNCLYGIRMLNGVENVFPFHIYLTM